MKKKRSRYHFKNHHHPNGKEDIEPKEYSHQWYIDNGYDENFEYKEPEYCLSEITKVGRIENITFIVSSCKTQRHYLYFIGGRQYGEKQLKEMQKSEVHKEESKRYVWNIISGMKDGDSFSVSESLISAGEFISICKIIIEKKVLWPSDISFNSDYSVVKRVG